MKKVNFTERVTLFNQDQTSYENSLIEHELQVNTTAPKRFGVMVVGLGGNNGSTLTAGVLANRLGTTWQTKQGTQTPNYYGSFTQCGTAKVGVQISDEREIKDVYKPIKEIAPLASPNDFVITGWDISSANVYEACVRAQVLEPDLLRQLEPELRAIKPMPAAFTQRYIASNQADRVDNVIQGTNVEVVAQLRKDISEFKKTVDCVVIMWTANTEETIPDIATRAQLEEMVNTNQELPGSVLYAYAAQLEGVTYLNGSPQNTFHTGIQEMARDTGACIAGADFKSGQTRFKTIMSDFLVGSGIRLSSVVSYNHLGNNDGKNLAESHTFKSKETSKAGCLDDAIESNKILYPKGNDMDHVVVIKYVPTVGDSKRALDEYTSKIFMNGLNTISSYNVCEDSLLATPLMIDMILLAEYFQRVTVNGKQMGPVLSYLSFFFKAPITNHKEYVINSFSRQREMLVNFLKATAGYVPEDNTLISASF